METQVVLSNALLAAVVIRVINLSVLWKNIPEVSLPDADAPAAQLY